MILSDNSSFNHLDIAIIGIAGRFPGAENVDKFWRNLQDGVESISVFSDQELLLTGVPPHLIKNANYVKASGVLSNVEMFDAHLFGYSPGEAAIMDPQHRIFMECAWEALEDAGCNAETYNGLIGVYAGASMNTYLYNHLRPDLKSLEGGLGYHHMIASDKDFLATKVSYKLNLKGPSLTVQTACSTSLVAVHLACQSIRSGECDMALAGGVSIRIPHKAGYLYQEGIVLSPDGHCRAFDAEAAGTVIGNGVGIVVLKLLADAIVDDDHIYAVIKGSAINNDGSLKAGYTAPSLDAQAAVIVEAQGIADTDADSITYVETHGTGTTIGDPIEIGALAKAFRISTDRYGFCAIGSVKSNIGHLDAAAGVAGLIKTALALWHKEIPPSLNFETPNPRIDFKHSPFYVNVTPTKWNTNGTPRRAGVSSFGIGGTNAHVILEEAPTVETSGLSRPWQLLLFSAKTASALNAVSANFSDYLAKSPDYNLADAAYTLQIGRKVFAQRRFTVCQNAKDLQTTFTNLNSQQFFEAIEEKTDRPVAFMFTGQGAQYIKMGFELYQTELMFRETVDKCCALLEPHLGFDLRDVLYPSIKSADNIQAEEVGQQLLQTAVTQPALFTIEYALAMLWMEWGIRPQALIGHSIGEYTAACLAGVFSLEDALGLVAARGKLMQQLPQGSMLSVALPERQVRSYLSEGLSIGVINNPSRCVISGPTAEIELLQTRLAQTDVANRRLHTSHAFHSSMMDPIMEPFKEIVTNITLNPPQIPCLSNVTGTWLTPTEATDPNYWARHLRQTVRFSDGLTQLLQDPTQILLEVGPGQMLTTLATRHPNRMPEQIILSSLRHPQNQVSDVAFLLTTLGKLWLAGAHVDWVGFYAHEKRTRVRLPTYPFERQRHWVDQADQTTAQPQTVKHDAKKTDITEWFYVPSWKRSPISGYQQVPSAPLWMVFADNCGLGSQMIRQLRQDNQSVIVVQAGTEFFKKNDDEYTINPANLDDYNALFQDLDKQGRMPYEIVHLWCITNSQTPSMLAQLSESLDLGFYSLLFLSQMLGKYHLRQDLQITAVCNNLQEVNGESVLCPEKATILGPVKTIPREYPNVSCRCVDVILPEPNSNANTILVDQLLTEIRAGSTESVVAYRGQHRWVQIFEPVRLEKPDKTMPRFKEGGVYLITGGLGGVGFTLAQHIAQTFPVKLALMGRSGLPSADEWEPWLMIHGENNVTSRKIRRIQELERFGAKVLPLCVDITNLEEMDAAIAQILAQFGSINGVIHAAGLPGGGMSQLKIREMAENVLAPKVKGTAVLNKVVGNMPLDFFVLCSSINSVVSRAGQIDYCAANAFLDAFVHWKNATGNIPTISINWDTWQTVGMAAETLEKLSAPSTNAHPQSEIDHPLLDQCLFDNKEYSIYVTQFAVARQWELHEHGILSKPTLPGTAYLEMARAAFEIQTGNRTAQIRDVYFLTPLILDGNEETEVRTVLKKHGDDFVFSVMSKASLTTSGWQEHAKGTITAISAAVPIRHTLEEIKKRCSEQEIINPLAQTKLGGFWLQRQKIMRGLPGSSNSFVVDSIVIVEQDNQMQQRSMEFGPRWHSLQWVKLGAREGLAFLELPEALRSDLQLYKLHPALLDFATSFLRLFKNHGSYLPLSYKQLTIHAPLPERVYSHVRFVDDRNAQQVTLRFDITLLDAQGTELVDIKEFAVIRVDDVGKLNTKAVSGIGSLSPFAPSSKERASAQIQLLQQDLEKGISPVEGVDVFTRILGCVLPQVIVSTRDLPTRIKQVQEQSASLLLNVPSAALSRQKHPRPNLMSTYAPPRNKVEQQLAEIWQDVLSVEKVGVHDDFFELGGDSLLITQIHSKFTKAFDKDMSVANMLQYPTIADLAQFLSERANVKQASFQKVQENTQMQKAAMKRRKEKLLKDKRLRQENI